MSEANPFPEMVFRYVESEIRDHFDMIEKACELSLQGGTCGVVVLGHGIARPHPRVPHGEIWDASACPERYAD